MSKNLSLSKLDNTSELLPEKMGYKLSNQALLNKAKLWCVLHGVKINDAVFFKCRKCPNWDGDYSCSLGWGEKLTTNREMNKVSNQYDLVYCIEWIKYV